MKFDHSYAFSFGKSKKGELEKIDTLYNPGPGEYVPVANLRTQPKWKIGSEIRAKPNTKEVPGPGQYSTTNYSLPQNPKYSIAQKTYTGGLAKSHSTPGPCTYHPRTHNGSAKFSIRIKPSESKVDINPGPGQYNIRSDSSVTFPSVVFGKEKKDGIISNEHKLSPGPADYHTRTTASNKTNPMYSFGRELRAKGNTYAKNSPGPGDYSYKEYIGKEAPKITISTKLNKQYSDTCLLPGPGQYNNTVNSVLAKAPSYRIGTATRDSLSKQKQAIPGPGQYVPDRCTNAVRAKTPSWVIGTSKRVPLNPGEASVPGVGNYNITNGLGGPKITFAGKNIPDYNERRLVPGPGQYNTNSAVNLLKHPSWKIGLSSRDDLIKKVMRENIPGPGLYTLNNNNDQKNKHRFGTEKRYSSKKDLYPGPGQYRIPCSVVDVNDYTRLSGKFSSEYKYV